MLDAVVQFVNRPDDHAALRCSNLPHCKEIFMKRADMTLPQLALLAGTRGLLGAGIGLLAADHLSRGQRRALGLTLTGIGLLSTLPLAAHVLGKLRHDSESPRAARSQL
jgi:hypothetical protein